MKPTDNQAEQDINQVLNAEKQAAQQIQQCEEQAAILLQKARERARAIQSKTETRIHAIHASHETRKQTYIENLIEKEKQIDTSHALADQAMIAAILNKLIVEYLPSE